MAVPAPQVLTASRLVDGDVVYWRSGRWTEALTEADVFASEAEAAAALVQAQRFVADNVVVNAYLFDVREAPGGVRPLKEREIIRALGPSVRRDIGKQATGMGASFVVRGTPPSPETRDDDVSI